MPTRFAVLGSGAWGTVVAMILAQNPQHRVSLWSARAEHADWHASRENARLLPGVAIPDCIELTTDIAAAVEGAELLILGIPTAYLRGTLRRIASAIPAGVPIVSLAKGLEIGSFRRPTEIAREELGPRSVAALSGPSHAEEVARGLPTTLVVASDDRDLAKRIQMRFSTDRFRVYTNDDLLGVELAGALKNVIGIAAGINDGLGFGDNSKSALLTRGLAEMARFGVSLGAHAQTFSGLAGMGDLITTCISKHGRNRAVGERLARGETLTDIQTGSAKVVEGVFTARSVFEESRRRNIDMPICDEVYRVLYDSKSPLAAVTDLMLRELRSEQVRI